MLIHKTFCYLCNMKDDKPLVSFIITYYNLPIQLLCKCIDSILQLSLRPFEREIIIVDDGSEVSPINELMKYGDDIIYVRQKNGGLSMARNKGVDVATGQYIQFVDADDHIIQATYEQCLNIVRQQEHVDMVMFDFSTEQQVETVSETVTPISGTSLMRNSNIHGTAWGYIFRKEVMGELRFTPGIYHEDEEFTPQLLLRAETVYPTHYQAYYYNKRENSITSKQDAANIQKRIDDREGVLFRLHNLCDKLAHQDRKALERRIAQLTMDYLYQIILETRSSKILDQRIEQLYGKGLFPLPDAHYSKKYVWFRKMTNCRLGRSILIQILPLLKRER